SGLSEPRPSVTPASSSCCALLSAPLSRERAEIRSSTSLRDLLEIAEQFPAHRGVLPQELDEIAPLRVGKGDSQLAAGAIYQGAERSRQDLLGLLRIGEVRLCDRERGSGGTGGCARIGHRRSGVFEPARRPLRRLRGVV